MKTALAALGAILACATPALADEYVIELVGITYRYNGQTNENIDLTIRPGDSVRWVWVTGLHNVVSGDHGDPDEGGLFWSGVPVLPPMEYTHIFNEPGDFRYHCEIHFSFGMTSSLSVRCASDFIGDLSVNTLDVLAFLNAWSAGEPGGDFNGDGTINTIDVLGFLNAWSSGC